MTLTLIITLGVLNRGGTAQATPTYSGASVTQYWNMPLEAFSHAQSVFTDSRTFYIGDSIVMLNGLELQVYRIQRNWQPSAVVAASYGNQQTGDDPRGRETILVWFRATNVGASPLGFNDNLFTLQVTGNREERVGHIASIRPNDYGDQGTSPWLLPQESKETFVPFLVTPGEKLRSLQYYLVPQLDKKATSLPTLTRLSILLSSRAASGLVGQTPIPFVFTPSATKITVN